MPGMTQSQVEVWMTLECEPLTAAELGSVPTTDPSAYVGAREAHAAYLAWCERQGVQAFAAMPSRFHLMMRKNIEHEAKGLEDGSITPDDDGYHFGLVRKCRVGPKDARIRGYYGMRLKDSTPEFFLPEYEPMVTLPRRLLEALADGYSADRLGLEGGDDTTLAELEEYL